MDNKHNSQEEKETPISFITVFPITKKLAKYYINENIKDSNAMNYENLYLFIAKFLRPPTTLKIKEFIEKRNPFFVNIEENTAHELKPNRESMVKEYIKKHFAIDYKKIEREIQEEQKDSLTSQIHADKLESIIEKNLKGEKRKNINDYFTGNKNK